MIWVLRWRGPDRWSFSILRGISNVLDRMSCGVGGLGGQPNRPRPSLRRLDKRSFAPPVLTAGVLFSFGWGYFFPWDVGISPSYPFGRGKTTILEKNPFRFRALFWERTFRHLAPAEGKPPPHPGVPGKPPKSHLKSPGNTRGETHICLAGNPVFFAFRPALGE